MDGRTTDARKRYIRHPMSGQLSPGKQRAVVLLSGGLDSATTLAIARERGFACYCLSIDYGQRHRVELDAAAAVARAFGASEHRVLRLGLDEFGGSALTDTSIAVPVDGVQPGVPVTYVPARNTVMLSLALAWAEVLASHDIFVGVNSVDYSGYPDCRPEYIAAFERMANLATRAAVEGALLRIHAPLIDLAKAQIIQRGNHSAWTMDSRFRVTRRTRTGAPAGFVTPAACGEPVLPQPGWLTRRATPPA
jgi:7-cyano-7-deazaguanine synthase